MPELTTKHIQMKNNFNSWNNYLVGLSGIAILLFVLLSACSRKIRFQTSSIIPAAEGTVQVKMDRNDNYHIEVDIKNMAEPDRLQPARKTYVVWMESADRRATNIGQINSSTSTFSKRLKATFTSVSPNKPTKVFITAEDDGTVQLPGWTVLSTENF
jgi:hypothetical protein